MLACLWIAVSPNNQKVVVYKELHEKDLIISKAAERIKQVNGNDKIRHTYAPPDLWSRTKDTGKSIEQTFKENGVSLYKTSNRRVDGWLAIKELLQVFDNVDVHTGETYPDAKLIIHSNCVNLIKNLPKIQRDEKNPNDCANDPHDITHILDSLRAYAITRSNGNKQEQKPKRAHDQNFMEAVMKWG
jgi:phage terminase large subunit